MNRDEFATLLLSLMGDGTGGQVPILPSPAPMSIGGLFGGTNPTSTPGLGGASLYNDHPFTGTIGFTPPMQPSRGGERVFQYEDGTYGTPYDDYSSWSQMQPRLGTDYRLVAQYLRAQGLLPE